MGLFQSKQTEIFEIKKVYWDANGNLRHGKSDRNRDNEVIELLQADTNDESDAEKMWMIIPSRWVRNWLLFAHMKLTEDPPGPIDMLSLLKEDSSVQGGWRPKKTLKPPQSEMTNAKGEVTEEFPGHYRRISLEAWIKLVDLYGNTGYAIAVVSILKTLKLLN